MRLRRPSRLPHFSYLGLHQYSLRFATYHRLRLFVSPERVSAALTQIQHTCVDEEFARLAYCFMPDHLHLLVQGLTPQSDLRRLVKLAKQRVAFVFRMEMGVPQVWQDGWFARRAQGGSPHGWSYCF